MKQYIVLKNEPDLEFKKGDKLRLYSCEENEHYEHFSNDLLKGTFEVAYIKYFEKTGLIAPIEEYFLPEYMRDIDAFIEYLERIKYVKFDDIGPFYHKSPLDTHLITQAWMYLFAEKYNKSKEWGDVKFYLYYGNTIIDFDCNTSIKGIERQGTVYFKDENFLEVFSKEAPQEIKDMLKGGKNE